MNAAEVARQEWLRTTHSTLLVEMGRTDSKASTLLALTGAALALLVGGLTGRPLPVSAAIAGWAAVAVVAAAVVVLALALRPSLRGTPPGSLLAWACGPDTVRAELADLVADPNLVIDRQAAQVSVLAGLAVTKFRRLRLAVDLLLVALPLAALVPVLGVLAR